MQSTLFNGADKEESKDKRWRGVTMPEQLDPAMPEAAGVSYVSQYSSLGLPFYVFFFSLSQLMQVVFPSTEISNPTQHRNSAIAVNLFLMTLHQNSFFLAQIKWSCRSWNAKSWW